MVFCHYQMRKERRNIFFPSCLLLEENWKHVKGNKSLTEPFNEIYALCMYKFFFSEQFKLTTFGMRFFISGMYFIYPLYRTWIYVEFDHNL